MSGAPQFSLAALLVLNEFNDPERTIIAEDRAAIRDGMSRAALLERCLEGAEPDRTEGWTDYVDALFAVTDAEEDDSQ